MKIKISELEALAGVNKNRIRSKVQRDERYQVINGELTLPEALRAVEYLASRDGWSAGLMKVKAELTRRMNGNEKADIQINGNRNLGKTEKKVTDGNVNGQYIDSEDVTGQPKVITFLQGSYWKGITALLAVTVSSVYLALFINNTAHDANLPIHPVIGYLEAVIFSVIGLTLAASNKSKKILIGGDRVSVANLWLFVFFSIEVAAMLSAWGIITSPIFCMTVLALMPPVTLLSYAHLFVSK